ncbi:hypothetical protein ROZALSC1DRAFT_26253, partial [Rozella allomycis CSF55]
SNYGLFELKFHEASLNTGSGYWFLKLLIGLVGFAPKPHLLLLELVSKNVRFPIEDSLELLIPFLENDNVKVDLLKSLQNHHKIVNQPSMLKCFRIILKSISDPQNRKPFRDFMASS